MHMTPLASGSLPCSPYDRLARLFIFAWQALSAHALPSQRTSVTREDGTQWAWGYDELGEVNCQS
jgi:hypothetical protein